jgi:selenocysteine-specific elongation factor
MEELPLLLGLPYSESRRLAAGLRDVSIIGSRLIAKATTATLREEALRRVEVYHQTHPSERGLSLETLRRLLRGPPEVASSILSGMGRRGEIAIAEGLVSMPGFVPRLEGGEATLERVISILEQAGLTPPTVAELEHQTGLPGLQGTLRFASQDGRVIAVERDRYFSPFHLSQFLATLRDLASAGPLTPPAIRERTGLSRKYLIPLLEYADRAGVTRRVGDVRVII